MRDCIQLFCPHTFGVSYHEYESDNEDSGAVTAFRGISLSLSRPTCDAHTSKGELVA